MAARKTELPLYLYQRGFSLIEVMVAIAILSFIVMAIVSVTGSSQDTAVKVVEEDRQLLQVETAMSRLEWDISQAYTPLYFSHAMEPTGLTENQGQAYNQMVERYAVNPRFAFPSYEALPVPIYNSEEKHTFVFFASSNRRKFRSAKQSRFAWVKYELVDPEEVQSFRDEEETAPEEGEGMVLTRKFLPRDVFSPEPIQWDEIKSQVLLRGVEKLVFEFWNRETRKWTENLATVKEGVHMIRGVKVNMEWIDPDGIKRTFIRVFRPLFPRFEPENMYKLIKEANAAANPAPPAGGGNGNPSSGGQGSSGQSGSGPGGGQ